MIITIPKRFFLKHLPVILLWCFVFVGTVHGKLQTERRDELIKQFRIFHALWVQGEFDKCVSYFERNPSDQNVLTLDKAKLIFGDAYKNKRREVTFNIMDWDDSLRIVTTTSWSRSGPDINDSNRLVMLEQNFFVAFKNDHLVVTHYNPRDITAESIESLKHANEQLLIKVNDISLTQSERIDAAMSLYINLWNLAQYDQLWALLRIVAEIAPDSLNRKDFRVFRSITKSLQKESPIPENLKLVVEKLMDEQR